MTVSSFCISFNRKCNMHCDISKPQMFIKIYIFKNIIEKI